jgi:predicted metal-dependent phosphoesterase TrpH
MALARGLAVVALTDHDTVSGVAEAQATAAETGLEVIAGVEVSSEGNQASLHILGFYVDPYDPSLNDRLQAMQDSRLGRAYQMLERLREMGIALEWEEVQALAGGESVGRPHVARALLSQGHVTSVQDAFERFLAPGRPAYIPRLRLAPEETIRMIVEAGGVPVLAHPAHSGPAVVVRIPELVGYGLRGLEVHYPYHSPDDVDLLLGLCREHGLLVTGGSDFHGPESEEGAPLGSIYVPTECAERLREAADL